MEYFRDGGSEKHLRDITGILKVSDAGLDSEYVDRWAKAKGLTEFRSVPAQGGGKGMPI